MNNAFVMVSVMMMMMMMMVVVVVIVSILNDLECDICALCDDGVILMDDD